MRIEWPGQAESTTGQIHRFERRVMGSPLRLTVTAQPRLASSTVESAWAAVSDEFDAVDVAMSRFRPDSGVTRLNQLAGTGTASRVEPRLYRAIGTADRAWRLTDGRFDPRILADLERLGHPGASLRSSVPIERPGPDRRTEPWACRRPREMTVRLAQPVDLGGIGKGLALRWAWRRLHERLTTNDPVGCLIDAGGDLIVGGPSPDGGSWSVGIEDPSGGDEPVAVVGVSSGALCTSSVRLGRWLGADGRPVHHLIDPNTGAPGGGRLVSVTVAGRDPAWSEIWSKALFLAGDRAIGAEARARGLLAWWIDEDGSLSMTPAARVATVWP